MTMLLLTLSAALVACAVGATPLGAALAEWGLIHEQRPPIEHRDAVPLGASA
jgi:hypothetical protein